MTAPRDLPRIGAALFIDEIPTYRDWLFDGARDLEIQDFFRVEVLTGDWRPLVDRARGLLDGHAGRLGIHGPFWGFSLGSEDPEVRQVVQRRMAQGLDVCEGLGATQMVVHSPFTTWDHHNMGMFPDAFERAVDRVRDSLGAALARAEDQGVVLVVENIEDVDPGLLRRMVEAIGSPALRLSIDTGHAAYSHGRTGGHPVDYFVRDAGALLHHVHLQDADGHADRHWRIGEGSVPWPEVFRALAAHAPPEARLVLELRDKGGIPASMEYLERLGLGR